MFHLATNQYPWGRFYAREGRTFEDDLDDGLARVAASGLDGFEPIAASPGQVARMVPLLAAHGLEMRSLYVNSQLHAEAGVEESIEQVLAIADAALEAGTRTIVTNPNPISWGGPEDKTDAQLELQAAALDRLGRELSAMGLVLAYHNHDAELRHAAREFHHMMVGTDPGNVTLCLDSHWIYRGAGDSAVAVYDVVELYADRVSELHLRQSVDGVWAEAFGPGDIDYERIAKRLHTAGIAPHLVLEQAVEERSPRTVDAVEAHRASRDYVCQLFPARG